VPMRHPTHQTTDDDSCAAPFHTIDAQGCAESMIIGRTL